MERLTPEEAREAIRLSSVTRLQERQRKRDTRSTKIAEKWEAMRLDVDDHLPGETGELTGPSVSGNTKRRQVNQTPPDARNSKRTNGRSTDEASTASSELSERHERGCSERKHRQAERQPRAKRDGHSYCGGHPERG